MIASLLNTRAVNMGYAQKLIGDLRPEQFTLQPAPGMNHPAWVLGHLGLVERMAGQLLGLDQPVSDEEQGLFGIGSAPTAEAGRYPPGSALMDLWAAAHAAVDAALAAEGTQAHFNAVFPMESMRGMFPTVGDGVVFMSTAHVGIHLGQISAWRRVLGLPHVM